MQRSRIIRRVGWLVAVLAASCLIAPSAFARVHVGIGISVPGISVGIGNCWHCGYWAAPRAYYQPAYPAPVYYPAPAYYAPRPVYYGYGYYAPYYPHHYYGHRYYRHGYYHARHDWHQHGGYYHHGHH